MFFKTLIKIYNSYVLQNMEVLDSESRLHVYTIVWHSVQEAFSNSLVMFLFIDTTCILMHAGMLLSF